MSLSKDQNPAQLQPDNLLSDASLPGHWRVVKTKSRREKALAQYMSGRQMSFYLPMFKKRQPGTKRTRYSLLPAFSGYIFCKINNLERYELLTTNHIANIIEVTDESRLICDLARVQKAISLDAPVYPYDFVQTGDEVVIKKGPFKDLSGIIQKKMKNFRLILNVKCLFMAVALDIDADHVEPVGSLSRA